VKSIRLLIKVWLLCWGLAFLGMACSSTHGVKNTLDESEVVQNTNSQTSEFSEIPVNTWQKVDTDKYLFWGPNYYWMQTDTHICSLANKAMKGRQAYWSFMYNKQTNQVRAYLTIAGKQYTIESYLKNESVSELYALDKQLNSFVKNSDPVPINDTQTRYTDTPCWKYTERDLPTPLQNRMQKAFQS